MWLMLSTLVLPMLIAPLLFLQAAWPFLKPVVGVLAIALGIINIIQSVRWFDKGVLREPMLWVLGRIEPTRAPAPAAAATCEPVRTAAVSCTRDCRSVAESSGFCSRYRLSAFSCSLL